MTCIDAYGERITRGDLVVDTTMGVEFEVRGIECIGYKDGYNDRDHVGFYLHDVAGEMLSIPADYCAKQVRRGPRRLHR